MAERGPYSKGIERREAILESTLNVFSELGSRKSSMRAIAEDVGISPALLQYYFSSREELLLEVFRQWGKTNGQLSAGMTHFAERRNPDSMAARARLRHVRGVSLRA